METLGEAIEVENAVAMSSDRSAMVKLKKLDNLKQGYQMRARWIVLFVNSMILRLANDRLVAKFRFAGRNPTSSAVEVTACFRYPFGLPVDEETSDRGCASIQFIKIPIQWG